MMPNGLSPRRFRQRSFAIEWSGRSLIPRPGGGRGDSSKESPRRSFGRFFRKRGLAGQSALKDFSAIPFGELGEKLKMLRCLVFRETSMAEGQQALD